MNVTADTLKDRTENWAKWLSRFSGETHAIEIGSYEGNSACWFAEYVLTHPKSTLLCIDAWRPIEPYTSRGTDMDSVFERFRENTDKYPRISSIRADSHEILKNLGMSRTYVGRFDFAYIDGSHWPVDVLEDSVLVWPLVKSGGIIIWDDYEWKYKGQFTEPKIAIDAFLHVYDRKYIMIDRGYQVCIQKV